MLIESVEWNFSAVIELGQESIPENKKDPIVKRESSWFFPTGSSQH
jgi:hypothetical protein